jgi:hypothetical protein
MGPMSHESTWPLANKQSRQALEAALPSLWNDRWNSPFAASTSKSKSAPASTHARTRAAAAHRMAFTWNIQCQKKQILGQSQAASTLISLRFYGQVLKESQIVWAFRPQDIHTLCDP